MVQEKRAEFFEKRRQRLIEEVNKQWEQDEELRRRDILIRQAEEYYKEHPEKWEEFIKGEGEYCEDDPDPKEPTGEPAKAIPFPPKNLKHRIKV